MYHFSKKYNKDTIHGRCKTRPPPIITPEGDIEWEVHQVLDSRLFGRWKKLQYLVSWEGYGPEENSWEPTENLENAPDVVAQFYKSHPQAPGQNHKGGSTLKGG